MSNRLAQETSPYLLQHAQNPVDWYPWGDEAFARARELDRPMLLSVGYSACHWCHVMAHESFENAEIAALMNELFVNVKVDREERPDVDSVYMQAVVAISGHGGWPMTVFLTPAGEPFFGGTYYPPADRAGLRGFPYVLNAVATAYRDQRDQVLTSAAQVRSMLAPPQLPEGALSTATLDAASARLLEQADPRHGGFGGAPKFPHPAATDFLLRRFLATRDRRLLDAALLGLDAMDRGGIHDQLGGGFHRYTVDATWTIPHFEKMLYDNAQLACVYLHAYQVTGEVRWRAVVEDVLDHALRELRLAGGGFASSQDADSPGGEGSYFVWTPQQLRSVLGEDDAALAGRVFGVTDSGNFEHATTVLTVPYPWAQLARALGRDERALRDDVERIRNLLLSARQERPAPATDTKVLTSWNALMLGALAAAGAALQRVDYLDAARECAAFLLRELRPDGVLLRTWRNGRAKIGGFLEDSAFLADALVSLYEAGGDVAHLDAARELAGDCLRRFASDGVLYDTAAGTDELLVRPRTIEDNPIPAGQSALASAMLRISALDGDAEMRDAALRIVTSMAQAVAHSPLAVCAMACAMDRALAPSREVAIVGAPDDDRTRALVATVHRHWLPDGVVAWGGGDVALLTDRPPVDGRAAAYVCANFTCRRPVTTPDHLEEALGATTA